MGIAQPAVVLHGPSRGCSGEGRLAARGLPEAAVPAASARAAVTIAGQQLERPEASGLRLAQELGRKVQEGAASCDCCSSSWLLVYFSFCSLPLWVQARGLTAQDGPRPRRFHLRFTERSHVKSRGLERRSVHCPLQAPRQSLPHAPRALSSPKLPQVSALMHSRPGGRLILPGQQTAPSPRPSAVLVSGRCEAQSSTDGWKRLR